MNAHNTKICSMLFMMFRSTSVSYFVLGYLIKSIIFRLGGSDMLIIESPGNRIKRVL